MSETGHAKPDYWQPELDRSNDPVVGVSWEDARAYAAWAGKRLPTEAEWGYAARGGSMKGKYPWGDTPDINYANFKSFGILPVKSLKPNGYGIYDMIGNVWEWCTDWYDSEYYYASSKKIQKVQLLELIKFSVAERCIVMKGKAGSLIVIMLYLMQKVTMSVSGVCNQNNDL